MVFRGKDIKNFTESDLNEMVRENETESLEIELKREMYGTNHEGKKEMLKDISAMANAYGGHIFIGIGEKNHCADSIVGIPDAMNHQSTIQKSCRSSIDQPIDGLEVHPIEVGKNCHVLAIMIPDSQNKPHAVDFQGHFRYYKRIGTDNQPLSAMEIRDMVLFEEYARDKVERFLEKRKTILRKKISFNQPNLVLSILPNRFADPSLRLSMDIAEKLFLTSEGGILYSGNRPEFTQRGIRALNLTPTEPYTPSISYEVYDNGYIEVILNAQQLYVVGGYYPWDLLRATYNGAKLLLILGGLFALPSRYTFIAWTVSTIGLALIENKEKMDPERHGKPIKFDEPEFEISHTVSDLVGSPDELISPLFQKLYRSFGLSFVRYLERGKLSAEDRQIVD